MAGRKKKILMLTAWASRRNGGIFESLRRQCRALVDDGRFEVEVLAARDRHFEADLPRWEGVPVRGLPHRGPEFLGFAPGLLKAMLESGADLLHLQGLWGTHSWAAHRWKRATGRPLVLSPHSHLNPAGLAHRAAFKRLINAAYQESLLRSCGALHAVSDEEARGIRAFGLTQPLFRIPYGIDPAPGPAPRRAGGEKILLFLGRINPLKGLEPLLRGWARARPGGRDWRLVVAGWEDAPGYLKRLKRQAQGLGLEGSVSFQGPKFGDEKDRLLRRSRAFILPSVTEGLPVSLLEALTWRLPVLATPACNLPEAFQAGAGIPLAPGAAGVAEGLSRLFALGPAALDGMGRRGAALARDRFDWRRIAARWARVYAWQLGQGRRPEFVSQPGSRRGGGRGWS